MWTLDRLGRNTRHVLEVIEELESRCVGFRSLTEAIDTTGPMGKAMLTIMAAFAQLERDTIVERTRAGLAAAAENNRHGGRPRKVDDSTAAKIHELKAKGINATDTGKVKLQEEDLQEWAGIRRRSVSPKGIRYSIRLFHGTKG